MDRVEEERQCFGTIVSSLQHAITCYRGGDRGGVEPLSLAESREFLELAGQLLGSESNPARLDTLLFAVSPPLLDVLHFTMTTNPNKTVDVDTAGFRILQTTAVANVGRVVTLCCEDAELSARLQAVMRRLGMVDIISRYLGMPDEATQQTAMETLFFLGTKLGMMKEIAALRITAWLCEQMRGATNPIIRNYAAAVLQRYAEVAPQELADEDFAAMCVDFFEEPSMGGAVGALLCRALVTVLDDYPQAYWRVFDARLRQRLGACCVQLLLLADMVSTVCALIETIAILEAAMPKGETAPHFLTSLLDYGGAEMLVDTDAPEHQRTCLVRIKTLLIICECCTAAEQIDGLSEHLLGCQRPLSILLAAPLKIPPFHADSEEYSRIASVVIALLCAKQDRARALIAGALKSFPGWVTNLDSLIVENIEQWLADESVELSIVDSAGVLLNATSYVDLHLPSAWYSVAGMREAAGVLFRDTSSLPSIVASSAEQLNGQAITASLTPSFKRVALTLAILTHGLAMTFGLNAVDAVDAASAFDTTGNAATFAGGNDHHAAAAHLFSADDVESITQWENEEAGDASQLSEHHGPPQGDDELGPSQQPSQQRPRSTSGSHGHRQPSPSIQTPGDASSHLVTTPKRAGGRGAARDIVTAWRDARPAQAQQQSVATPRPASRHAAFQSTVATPNILVNRSSSSSQFVRRTAPGEYDAANSPVASRRGDKQASAASRPWR